MMMCPCADRYAVYVTDDPCKGCGIRGRMCASCLEAHQSTCLKQQNDLFRAQLKALGMDPEEILKVIPDKLP